VVLAIGKIVAKRHEERRREGERKQKSRKQDGTARTHNIVTLQKKQ
jgi:hypothetical protein